MDRRAHRVARDDDLQRHLERHAAGDVVGDPRRANSDHPGYAAQDTGPSWVASIVNAIGQSSYWNSTAVIVVWDDWGGFYDPVPPPLPRDKQGGPGFRVPMLVVSPYVPTGSGVRAATSRTRSTVSAASFVSSKTTGT